jgi:hypothetical protein
MKMKQLLMLTSLLMAVSNGWAENDCKNPKNPPSPTDRAPIEKLVDSFVANTGAGETIRPKVWNDQLKTSEVDLNELIHTDYPNGIAYGAVASQLLNVPFDEVVTKVAAEDSIMGLIAKVKTLRNTDKIFSTPNEKNDEFCIKTAIKVPVVPDFHTEVRMHLFKATDKESVLEWRQIDQSGELVYNQGAVIIEPADANKTKVSAIGIHIIKEKNKVPWLGRSTARAFARSHYGNFVTALRELFLK